MVEGEDAAAASLQSFLEWAAAELGISDSPYGGSPLGKSSCLGRSLFVSHFPHAGGYGSLCYCQFFLNSLPLMSTEYTFHEQELKFCLCVSM